MQIQPIYITNPTPVIDLSEFFDRYIISGTINPLSSSWGLTTTGTVYAGRSLTIEYQPIVTLGSGIHVTILGTQIPDTLVSKKLHIEAVYISSWNVKFSPSLDDANLISATHIIDANVTLDKIEAVASGKIIVGNVSNRPTAVTPTGKVTISNTGVTSITALAVTNTEVNDVAIGKLTVTGVNTNLLSSNGASGVKESTITEASLSVISSVNAGVAAAGKAVVLTTGNVIDTLDITSPKINGTAVTVTAVELNKNAGVSAGVATASKTMVLGASKNIDELDIALLKIGTVSVTSTAAELNKLDNVTAVTADLELLAGLAGLGITAADLQALKYFATNITSDVSGIKFLQGVKRNNKSLNASDSLTVTDDIILVTMASVDVNLTLPLISAMPDGVYTVIIVSNPTVAADLIVTGSGSDSVVYGGASAFFQTVTAPIASSTITVCNNGATWIIGV